MAGGVVLVVDDDQGVREASAEMLRGEGYSVVEAADATMALDQLRDDGIDAVILDVRMPDHDGFWVLDQLENLPPVILVTAHSYERKAMEKLEKVSHYLQKPVEPSELLWAVAKVMAA